MSESDHPNISRIETPLRSPVYTRVYDSTQRIDLSPPKGISPVKRLLNEKQKEIIKNRIREMLMEETKYPERHEQQSIRQRNVAILEAILSEIKSNPTLLKCTDRKSVV